ncbi:CHY zinc finger protein [Paenibacillus arenosi]|uniref:CHY-type domain-containing protein n=1 Tax=Paenibacillus arenosi TaxID=2774142 RepID=A0ABR9AZG8_9BACL|nr:CHY zinc finger protein [Paenibacillus arenosi]MBD8499546.1 hypothetical protein [Paenibacillus arenosi]
MKIYGAIIDSETRCTHYHTVKDIIAIKFYCCNRYYPCYKCHEENEDHDIQAWPQEQFEEKAVLCGSCRSQMTILQYMNTNDCPYCQASFNERCALHYSIYFESNESGRTTHG